MTIITFIIVFITFEGGEGSGKTTQARLLVERLEASGIEAVFTREPGGTELAEEIRNLLLTKHGIDDPLTEFIMLTAARHDHVARFIKPKLKSGITVVCDRFFDSSIAYQGYTKGLDLELMRKLHTTVFGDFKPNLTFLIDIDPEVALARIKAGRETNHYDAKDLSFHLKIRQALLECAHLEPARFEVIDGNQSMNAILGQLEQLASSLLFS